jgi:hypothetical protein
MSKTSDASQVLLNMIARLVSAKDKRSDANEPVVNSVEVAKAIKEVNPPSTSLINERKHQTVTKKPKKLPPLRKINLSRIKTNRLLNKKQMLKDLGPVTQANKQLHRMLTDELAQDRLMEIIKLATLSKNDDTRDLYDDLVNKNKEVDEANTNIAKTNEELKKTAEELNLAKQHVKNQTGLNLRREIGELKFEKEYLNKEWNELYDKRKTITSKKKIQTMDAEMAKLNSRLRNINARISDAQNELSDELIGDGVRCGGDIVSSLDNLLGNVGIKIPELHLPGHQFTGPFTNLNKRLNPRTDQPWEWSKPYNKVDEVALHHDKCYRDAPNETSGRATCDDIMLDNLNKIKPSGLREQLDKFLATNVIKGKKKLNL